MMLRKVCDFFTNGICLLLARKTVLSLQGSLLEDWGSSKTKEGSRLLCIGFDGMRVKELVALPQKSYFISCLYFTL